MLKDISSTVFYFIFVLIGNLCVLLTSGPEVGGSQSGGRMCGFCPGHPDCPGLYGQPGCAGHTLGWMPGVR